MRSTEVSDESDIPPWLRPREKSLEPDDDNLTEVAMDIEACRKKYIFVVGGVCSSIGKGVVAASLGRLLKSTGRKPVIKKIDPYLNIDPGTMSPLQHGEVFILNDGSEVDLDFGHYERFIDEELTGDLSITMGQVHEAVLADERRGDYLGQTVQVVPHITDEIKKRIWKIDKTKEIDTIIVEVGGTIGDMEISPPLEAIRQFQSELPREDTMVVLVSYVPYLEAAHELKTKPTQLATRMLRESGLHPNLLIARANREIPQPALNKIALFAGLNPESVIPMPNLDSIYEGPIIFNNRQVSKLIQSFLGLPEDDVDLHDWIQIVETMEATRDKLEIALVSKYSQVVDSYISIYAALQAAGVSIGREIFVHLIDAELIEKGNTDQWGLLKKCGGIILPPGFGSRGSKGKIAVANYALANDVPYLGICLGMHTLAIALGRNFSANRRITSQEFDPDGQTSSDNYIIHYLPGQDTAQKGGSMRLGTYPANLIPGSRLADIYGNVGEIFERHRHRLEFNNAYRSLLEKNGVVFSGVSPDGSLVEAIEMPSHPFMIGTQYHPELLSRPDWPHPLFVDFLRSIE